MFFVRHFRDAGLIFCKKIKVKNLLLSFVGSNSSMIFFFCPRRPDGIFHGKINFLRLCAPQSSICIRWSISALSDKINVFEIRIEMRTEFYLYCRNNNLFIVRKLIRYWLYKWQHLNANIIWALWRHETFIKGRKHWKMLKKCTENPQEIRIYWKDCLGAVHLRKTLNISKKKTFNHFRASKFLRHVNHLLIFENVQNDKQWRLSITNISHQFLHITPMFSSIKISSKCFTNLFLDTETLFLVLLFDFKNVWKNSREFSQHVYTLWLSKLEWAMFDFVDAWLSFRQPFHFRFSRYT